MLNFIVQVFNYILLPLELPLMVYVFDHTLEEFLLKFRSMLFLYYPVILSVLFASHLRLIFLIPSYLKSFFFNGIDI